MDLLSPSMPRSPWLAAALAVCLAACQSTPGKPASVEEQRASIHRHAQESLAKLYAAHPKSRDEIAAAAGYAVFDLSSVNAVLVVGQRGHGMIVDNRTRIPIYMNAARAGTGPGLGYQELRQIFIFANKGAMEQFVLAQGAGGDVSASTSVGTSNVQQSFNPNIRTYQLTEKGFAVQANWGGTVYAVDQDLACPGGCPPLPP